MRSVQEINEALELVILSMGAISTFNPAQRPSEMLLGVIAALAWAAERKDIPGFGDTLERLLGNLKNELEGYKGALGSMARSREN